MDYGEGCLSFILRFMVLEVVVVLSFQCSFVSLGRIDFTEVNVDSNDAQDFLVFLVGFFFGITDYLESQR